MKKNEGAVALFTLVFFVVIGVGMMVMLWGIGYSTGTYNRLYLSTQQAAYAAVTTRPPDAYQFNSTSSQPELFCDPSPQTNLFKCTNGPTLAAATKVLKQTYQGTSADGTFGQSFNNTLSGSVRLVNENFQPECLPTSSGCTGFIYAYELNGSPSRQNQECAVQGAVSGTNNTGDTSTILRRMPQNPPADPANGIPAIADSELPLACWQVRERNIVYPPQSESGVVVRTQTTIKVPPGCSSNSPFCPTFTLNALAVATISQPEAQKEYGKDDDRGPKQTVDTTADNTWQACPLPDTSGAPKAGGILPIYDYTDKKLYLYAFAQNSTSAKFTVDGQTVSTTIKRGNEREIMYQAIISKDYPLGSNVRLTFQAFNAQSSSELQKATANIRSSKTRYQPATEEGQIRAGLPYCPGGSESPPAPVVDKPFIVDSNPTYSNGKLIVQTATRNADQVQVQVTNNGSTKNMATVFDGDNGGNQYWRSELAVSGRVNIVVTATASNGKTSEYRIVWTTP